MTASSLLLVYFATYAPIYARTQLTSWQRDSNIGVGNVKRHTHAVVAACVTARDDRVHTNCAAYQSWVTLSRIMHIRTYILPRFVWAIGGVRAIGSYVLCANSLLIRYQIERCVYVLKLITDDRTCWKIYSDEKDSFILVCLSSQRELAIVRSLNDFFHTTLINAGV